MKKTKPHPNHHRPQTATHSGKRGRLYFEQDEQKPPSKLIHTPNTAQAIYALHTLHNTTENEEERSDNIGVETTEGLSRTAGLIHDDMVRNTTPRRKVGTSDKRSAMGEGNTHSAQRRRRNKRRRYTAMRQRESTTSATARAKLTTKAVALRKSLATAAKNPKVIIIVIGGLLVIAFLVAIAGLLTTILQGGITNILATSYTSENEDIVAADMSYTELEEELQRQIDSIERDHPDYDEYRYDLAPITHDPHELAAYLTARLINYTASRVQGEIQTVFDRQYTLTLTHVVEVRYRTETRTRTTTDSEGNTHTESYTVEVAYNYYILDIKLTNKGVDSVARTLLTAEQLEMYEVYRETKGNKPDLF